MKAGGQALAQKLGLAASSSARWSWCSPIQGTTSLWTVSTAAGRPKSVRNGARTARCTTSKNFRMQDSGKSGFN